jgi:hypothetical protein
VIRSQPLRLNRGGFPSIFVRLFGTVALAAVALEVVHVSPTSAAVPTYSNGFEENTHDWTTDFGGTITRKASGVTNPPDSGGYANAVASAAGGYHARLDRTIASCFAETGGGGPTVQCQGPLTKWGGYNSKWPVGGYTTQLDIYLDTAYATANPDTYGGDMACLLPPGNARDPNCKGTRFDYSSAINNTSGAHLRDLGFNVSTGLVGDDCTGFTVLGTTNVDRIGANPNLPGHQCIETSGWYTFKHTFSEANGFLKVLMEIIPVSGGPATASFTITGIDAIGTVGCNRYGWLTNQEIWGLPIDNASMTGCGTPPPVVVDPPPVIVLPPDPGPAQPPTAGPGPPVPVPPVPPGDQGGNEIITRNVRSCVIEVRALGPSRVLIARGVARVPASGAGRLVVRVDVKPKGKILLSKNFGGVIANVRALCRSTSGTLHRLNRSVRVVLLVEHRLTPPGAWVPDQPILTDIGHRFMNFLRQRLFRVRSIQCDGYTATWVPSPADPPTLSLNRAKRVCTEMKRVGGVAKARVRLVPHGRADPIATNSTEPGRRVNRRVFVTIVHQFVYRS